MPISQTVIRQSAPVGAAGDYLEGFEAGMRLGVERASAPIIDTLEALDALPVGSVIINEQGNVWRVDSPVTDNTAMRYESAGYKSYRTGALILRTAGPFLAIWLPQESQTASV